MSLTQTERFVTYLRVSTTKQGVNGLGIEAQRMAVDAYVARQGLAPIVLAEYVEVESGRKDDRPELMKAINHAKLSGARLVVGKLDRLSRDVAFIANLRKSGVEFVAADMPEANSLTINVLASVAEHEREMISQRTRAALAAAKARGVKLGNPNGGKHLASLGVEEATVARIAKADNRANDLIGQILSLEASGITTALGVARALNERGILTPSKRSGAQWTAKAVIRLKKRQSD